jgi:hypothetical protein
MRKLFVVVFLVMMSLALAQNESGNESAGAVACSGLTELSLSPTSPRYFQQVTAAIGGFSEGCDGKIAYLRKSNCKGVDVGSCELLAGKCNVNFEAPNATGNVVYYACVDMDDNGAYISSEYKSGTVSVRAPTCDELEAVADETQTAADYSAVAACYYKLIKTSSDIGSMTKCDFYYVSAANISAGLEKAQYYELAAGCNSKNSVKTRGQDLYYTCAGAYMTYAYSLEKAGNLLDAITYYGKAAEGCYKNTGETGNLTHYSFLRNTYIVKLQAKLNGQQVTIPYDISKLAANPKLALSQITAGNVTTTPGTTGQQGSGDITLYAMLAVVVVAGIIGGYFGWNYYKKKKGGMEEAPEEEELPDIVEDREAGRPDTFPSDSDEEKP